MKMRNIFLILLLLSCSQLTALDKTSAYIMLYAQETSIVLKNNHPICKTEYKINFKFNDENSLKLYRSYPIYYSYFDKLENLTVYTKNMASTVKLASANFK
jgi:hypothetical protein